LGGVGCVRWVRAQSVGLAASSAAAADPGSGSSTAKSCHASGTPLRAWVPTISESHPRASDEVGDGPRDEDFVGFGVRLYALGDVDGDAADVATAQLDLTRAQPTRTWRPIARTAPQMARAQRTARPGPSKAAKTPSPVIWISRPRKRSSSARVRPSWVTNSSDHLRSPMPATWSAARSQPQAGPICQNDARED